MLINILDLSQKKPNWIWQKSLTAGNFWTLVKFISFDWKCLYRNCVKIKYCMKLHKSKHFAYVLMKRIVIKFLKSWEKNTKELRPLTMTLISCCEILWIKRFSAARWALLCRLCFLCRVGAKIQQTKILIRVPKFWKSCLEALY